MTLDPHAMAGLDTHETVARLVDPPTGEWVVDAGAGAGALSQRLALAGHRVLALGIERGQYLAGPPFVTADLDRGLPLRDASVRGIAAVELVEHLENPLAFVRDCARVLLPGGWLVVTTPNLLSLSSKLSFVLFGHHLYFDDEEHLRNGHISPLSVVELDRIAARAGLVVEVETYNTGKLPVPGIRHRLPLRRAAFRNRALGDALVLKLRKTGAPAAGFSRG